MLQKESKLKIADNSGAREAKIISVNGSTRKRWARVGDVVKVAVKKATPGCSVKKSDVVDVVIVRTRKAFCRADGTCVRFDDNAAVVLGKDNVPVGSAVFGPIAREVKDVGFVKIASLAQEIV